MQLLVILTVTLLGAAADDQYNPYRGTPQYSGAPQYTGPVYRGAPQYSGTPQYSSHGSNKGPVGGPAPLDAVQKATEQFNKLYKEAAARAAAAPDDHEIYTSQQYRPSQPHVSSQSSGVHSQFHAQARPNFHGTRQQFHASGPSFSQTRYGSDDDSGFRSHAAAANHVSGPPQPVQDTPEVAAAKAKFHREFQRRAQAAANAPDDHDGGYKLQATRYYQPDY